MFTWILLVLALFGFTRDDVSADTTIPTNAIEEDNNNDKDNNPNEVENEDNKTETKEATTRAYVINWSIFGGGGLVGGAAGPDPPPTTTTTTTTTQRPTTRRRTTVIPSTSTPPDRPTPGDEIPHDPPFLCIDLVVIIDVSCSVKDEWRQFSREAALAIIRNGTTQGPTPDLRVGFLSYSLNVEHHFYLNNFTNLADIEDTLLASSTETEDCKTHTFKALTDTRTRFFTEAYGDRHGSPNVVLLFTDGRTIPSKKTFETLNAAQRLKDDGVELYVIAVPNRKDFPGDKEFRRLPSLPVTKHLLNASLPGEMGRLLNHLEDDYTCFQSNTLRSCVDIVFAFDFSCSIDLNLRNKSIEIAKLISQRVKLGGRNGASIAAFSFHQRITNELGFTQNGNTKDLLNTLDQMDTSQTDACKTKIYLALNKAEELFTEYDRDDLQYPDLLVMFGDGVTAPYGDSHRTIDRAAKLKNAPFNTTIFMVTLPNKNDNPDNDIELIVSKNPLDPSELLSYSFESPSVLLEKFQELVENKYSCFPQN